MKAATARPQKGGVDKTTTVVNLVGALVRHPCARELAG